MPRLTNRFDHFTTSDKPRPVSCDIDIPMTDSVDSIDITIEQDNGPAKFLQMRRTDRQTNSWHLVTNLPIVSNQTFQANSSKPSGAGMQKLGDKLKAAMPQGVSTSTASTSATEVDKSGK